MRDFYWHKKRKLDHERKCRHVQTVSMTVYIVTTTINQPTLATRKFAKISLNRGYKFIVVGDKKTPHEAYENMDGVYYLHPDIQDKKYKQVSDSIGWNSIQRRNLGFIEAYNEGADIVATIDDDNVPYDNWGEDILIEKNCTCDLYEPSVGVFDPLSVTNTSELWHRGYPIELLEDRLKVKYLGKTQRSFLVQADLWDGDPDIDAMARLIFKPIVKYNIKTPFCSGAISPFDSQNTFLARKVLPYYMIIPHVGRMDDIWGSYILQHYFPQSVVYNKATVYQDRNDQSIVKNLEDEILGYKNTFKFINNLSDWESFLPDASKRFVSEYSKCFR